MDDKHPFLKSPLFLTSSMTTLLLLLNPFTTPCNRALARPTVSQRRIAETQEPRCAGRASGCEAQASAGPLLTAPQCPSVTSFLLQ